MSEQPMIAQSDVHGHIVAQKKFLVEKLLVCPVCKGELSAHAGRYICQTCERTYPVVSGVPRFLTDLSRGEQQVGRSFDFEHTNYRDSRHLHFTPQLIQQWLDDIKLPAEYFKGKVVLDVGCGSGRWTWAMASLGATVVAVDLTSAGVEITHQATAQFDNVAVLQASVFELPFRPESFDLVVSWGVLHHTPNTRAAFECIAPLVKPGGQLYVMVYERHNPVKFFFTSMIRWILRRLPEARRYKACRHLIIRNLRLYYRLQKVMICAPYPRSGDSLEVSTLQFGLYDAYAPVFNHLHRREEVEGWFRACRFDQLTLTKPVRFTAWGDVLRSGECGGTIQMRGVRR